MVVTASYDLFKLKLLPAMLEVFEHLLRRGRYWAADRVLEIADPDGHFHARRSDDTMWGRVILRSAESTGGLESATARSAWLDEAGQDSFTVDAWRAIRRRLALWRGRSLITTTLYNLGWLVQQVVNVAQAGGVERIYHSNDGEIIYTDNPQANIALVQFDSIVNPAYPRTEFESARAGMPDDEFQMFYRGRVATLRGMIYDVFQRTRHTCPRFAIPATWKRYLGLDFGGANTAATLWAEEPGTGKLYGYREYLAGGRTAKQHAEALLEGEPGRPMTFGGAHSEGQWRQEFGAGGLAVREPMTPDVWVQINRVYGQFKTDQLVLFDDLHGTLDQIGSYRRKRDREGNVTDDIENKDTYHYLDSMRYVIGSIRGGLPRAKVLTVETQI